MSDEVGENLEDAMMNLARQIEKLNEKLEQLTDSGEDDGQE